MAQEVDWLSSQAGVCKINLYSPATHKDQERKVICFVDVANLNSKERDGATGRSKNISDPDNELDLANMEEREVIIIKDNEQNSCFNTEGAVCLFKQGSIDDDNVVSWLNNDLQKYAVGFQHALTSLRKPRKTKVLDLASRNNNNTSSSAGSEGGNSDDIAYYANKLCNLVVEMTRKEIKEKWESSGKCTRHIISPHSNRNKVNIAENMERCKTPPEIKRDDPFSGDMANHNDFKQHEAMYMDKERKADDMTSISKGMMVYANQVASDMMLSFLKTMRVQKGRHPPPACAVLKEVLMKHTREIVSDLIDSSMKNLHNITGALMTDSDFVCGLKRNLYKAGTQKTAEVLEVMVKRLFKLILGDDKQYRAQNFTFANYKAGGARGHCSQGMQFASMKRESCDYGKERAGGPCPRKHFPAGTKVPDKQSLDLYARELLVTALQQIQQHLLEKNKDCRPRECNTSSYGYIPRDYDRAEGSCGPKFSHRSCDRKADPCHSDSLKDKGHLIMSMVQKILDEAGLNLDENCGDKNRG
ncbi:A-kinase anchor protein 4-like [Podarcis raffonei]|uniref:A-kinase anchor protein 4-like n=1 Tax=Podarcis raffonei TaxID=65483 RepID=UPI0023298283|nr:A-kinase anchor protein 4-like [Podarcis raffonei]